MCYQEIIFRIHEESKMQDYVWHNPICVKKDTYTQMLDMCKASEMIHKICNSATSGEWNWS